MDGLENSYSESNGNNGLLSATRRIFCPTLFSKSFSRKSRLMELKQDAIVAMIRRHRFSQVKSRLQQASSLDRLPSSEELLPGHPFHLGKEKKFT
jgi:hypothetical protein